MKGANINLVHSRSVAAEKRKRTLLQEFRRVRLTGPRELSPWRLLTELGVLSPQSGKAGGIVDRRFGEADPTLDADDKALRRLQRLRQTQLGKGGRFALGGASRCLRFTCAAWLI